MQSCLPFQSSYTYAVLLDLMSPYFLETMAHHLQEMFNFLSIENVLLDYHNKLVCLKEKIIVFRLKRD